MSARLATRLLSRLTLARFFGLVLGAGGLLLVLLLSVFYRGSRQTVLDASERLMLEASHHLTRLIDGHLAAAEETEAAFERQWRAGLVNSDDPAALEATLLRILLGNVELTEVTFTHPGGQVSAFRASAAADADVVVRRVLRDRQQHWQAWRRSLGPAAARPDAQATLEPDAPPDPTHHDTYTTPVESPGESLWSDIALSELDDHLPEDERRRVVTLQTSLWCRGGQPGEERPCEPDPGVAATDDPRRGPLFGVLRVGLLSGRVDALARMRVDDRDPSDPHRVFVCDQEGRLITRVEEADRFTTVDEAGHADPASDDLRVIPAHPLPPGIREALRMPGLRTLARGASSLGRVNGDGVAYLVSLAGLPAGRTRDWVVGVVVPEAHYLGPLAASVRRLAGLGGLLLLLAALVGAAALRRVRRDLGRLVAETSRLRGFDFTAATAPPGSFRDVSAAIDSLEQAKTALRGMTKYVPLDLVRQLYLARVEPMLGGHLQEVTILFSDIAGFTTVSERLPPDRLALALGDYLAALTGAVHATAGIIDKYTGDGVMALWNAPTPIEGHARRACEAALGCVEASEALFRSPAWRGLPAWRTRFGIHRAEVTVGNFGAPDRMSYTALGDGVNLAARLEGLGKQYGVHILVSTAVRAQAGPGFRFRRIDRVAVKGKHEGVEVHELVGRDDGVARPQLDRYEAALDAYFARGFERALVLLADVVDDPPSAVLAARCRALVSTPPPAEWNGVYVAQEK